MKWTVRPSVPTGPIVIPPSKSHTIRAMLVATLAAGGSVVRRPLLMGDGASALRAASSMGAAVDIRDGDVFVTGIGADYSLGTDLIDMGNSGTGLNLFCSAAALGARERRFDGDDSLRSRPVRPLLNALEQLGAVVIAEGGDRDLPFVVRGPLKGGRATVDGISSQYVSSLLFAAPLMPKDTHITVHNLHEQPYVEMTLWWLANQGIEIEYSKELTSYKVRGGQKYKPFDMVIPADFSSAAFAAVAAAIGGAPIELCGLDFSDTQGDKEVFLHLEAMGATVERSRDTVVVSSGGELKGTIIDLNRTPDALPALAIAAAAAKGETVFTNVAQARIKETDRIAVMVEELGKMGITAKELPDGMVVRGGKLKGARVNSHKDHRVAMALALAGMNADGEMEIDGTEAAEVTYPTFVEDFVRIGANISVRD